MMLVDDAMIGDVAPLIDVMTTFVGLAQIVTTWLPSPSLSLSLQIFLASMRNNCYHLWFPFLEDLLNNDVQTTNVQNLTHRNFTQDYRRKSYA